MSLLTILSNGDLCFIALVVTAGIVVGIWRMSKRDK